MNGSKMGHPRPRRKVSVEVDADLADWVDRKAKERNLGREHIIETALMDLRAAYGDTPRPEE